MNSQNEEEAALKVSHGDHSGGRGRGNSRGRGRGRGRQSFDKSTIECYRCHNLGHLQWECSQKEKEVHFVEAQEEMLLMAYLETNIANKEDTWFLDSGCSNHMCGKEEYFFDLDERFKDFVKLGNNSSLNVRGKGNIRLLMHGISPIITGVFYVPDLKNNLLSIGQLQEKGLSILFQRNKCKVYHPEKGLIMDTVMASNRMFALSGYPERG
ncbi:uncharacterized protein LOC119370394 [Jatropha curcas]|uniref:uncharacterized protein LOC119370394 n=1 Tax=Jatropha curcas TaxID=180498 RepID=UPI001893EE82|nr:uncharacterized protein LOC119370394 [Jatropha curcas]